MTIYKNIFLHFLINFLSSSLYLISKGLNYQNSWTKSVVPILCVAGTTMAPSICLTLFLAVSLVFCRIFKRQLTEAEDKVLSMKVIDLEVPETNQYVGAEMKHHTETRQIKLHITKNWNCQIAPCLPVIFKNYEDLWHKIYDLFMFCPEISSIW